MPFVFYTTSADGASPVDITTSATPNTEQDDAYVRANNSSPARSMAVSAVLCSGKSAGLTVISGIAYRLKKWTTTASSGGGVVLGPVKLDPGSITGTQVVAGFRSNGAITSGTGGPTYIGGFTSGATGPGGWIGPNANSYIEMPEPTGASSIDIFSASVTPSLKYEAAILITEY